MIVWRVEDQDGFGPWAGKERIKQVWKHLEPNKEYRGFRRGDHPALAPDRMPGPNEDQIVVDRGFVRTFFGPNKPWRYAYESLGKLFKWWGYSKEAAEEAGLKLVAYDVQDPQIHENQVVFDPDTAKPVIMSTFDRAHRAFISGTEEELYASD